MEPVRPRIRLMRPRLAQWPQTRYGGTNGRAENRKGFGGARRRFEWRPRRGDFGDVIGNLSRKSLAANVSIPHVRLGIGGAYSMTHPVT